ncbi:PSD1 and planctomycete cytochrome C domain-containing protein [Aeoliella sp. ICT_H6.2]|uniref:PSD1 and planctomycete cytochrome C domain-containing protein n=1 Tax=Aeoliella straminimaris TaxID=2954799 RepID=A0A9X2JH04_9BACT|nr:PSD1 and planctomycete cytochrome C domain-containing protein [Aeoliella straminimaris]MCO6045296.1 PSD1 and planctomycete cytochrome C domain-containing protein [Aeoliella straminimaris]
MPDSLRGTATVVVAVAVLVLAGSTRLLASDSSAAIDFNSQIRPIFNAHCSACHGGVKQSANISFVYPEQVVAPDGWIVEPGEPESSLLLERVTSADSDLVMPPPGHGPPLSNTEIALLRQWIAEGAKWHVHWAFEKPVKAEIPGVQNAAWPRTNLDYFILAKLESQGLTPSEEAEPFRWLRRVSLDLTGLPPTAAELKQFGELLKVDREAAYESTVDRLLSSPHFGERWASVWLDQVRYADSQGLGLDAPRTIWAYRDWVIRAFNDDLPYDEFTAKQIAGDMLPDATPGDILATACHRLTQTNEEGGTDDEEFRVAAVLDRVNTVWHTWQGMTFECAQCHSHPYEPFKHEEYYQFVAFFNNTVDTDLGSDAPLLGAPLNPSDHEKAGALDHQIADLEESIWRRGYKLLSDSSAWTPIKQLVASTSNSTVVKTEVHNGHGEFRTVGTVTVRTPITVETTFDEPRQITAIRLTGVPQDRDKAIADSEWGFVWSHVAAELVSAADPTAQPITFARVFGDEPHPLFDPQESLDEKSHRGFGAYSRIYYPRAAAFVLREPLSVAPGDTLRITLSHNVVSVGAFGLVTDRGHVSVSDDPRFTDTVSSEGMLAELEQLAQLKEKRRDIRSVNTPVLRERPRHLARQTHVFIRGAFLDKGEQVDPDVPESLPDLPTGVEPNRKALADWLVSPDNPLTARVAVNRLWARLFGVGLVETEEDFGTSGEPPSDPELLDYLAVQFQDDFDWSIKSVLREIVLSSTYRQSSKITPELLERDPHNRLISRGPKQRLSAETIRDQALAISGLLNSDMYGPPVRPPIPAEVWQPFVGDRWPATEPGDPSRYRRSIYTYTKRSIPYPMYATFDQPSREFCSPRRLRSNTPLQALEMLNSETMAECATALAAEMRKHGDTLNDQIIWGFERATCRSPNEDELSALTSLGRRLGDRGLSAVATALLNLDEVLTK